MRIHILLVLALSLSIATAKKESSKSNPTKLSTNKTSTRSAKSLIENRGKRTLTNLGYPGFSYSIDFGNRRQGYSDARAFYPQDGLYNGQSAIGQYSIPETSNHLPDYSQFSPFPQYLEAPEPIIEIIIKDSNESVPTTQPQPIVQKKKKEKVHVYYVKYKKDENNKLHLDEPIASLSENEASVDETEEIVHYPSIVTPIPPLKTTTLRTVIHPDSEKFHSNSGIHVTFGSEDKSQSGHELQEHNAESIQRSVVALPQAGSFNAGPAPSANVRADFSSPRASIADSYQSFYQNQNQNQQREYKPSIQQQQLPEAQALTPFRPQLPLQHQTQPQHQNQQQQQQLSQIHQSFQSFQQNSQPQHYDHQQQQQQQQHQQQRPFYNQAPVNSPNQFPKQQQYQRQPTTTSPPPSTPPQYQQYQQQNFYQQQQKQQQQQQQYYQFNQQPKLHPVPSAKPQQFQQNHQQHHQQNQYQQRPIAQAQKQTVFFPTPPPKSQDPPSRQSLTSYQPVKFRPTPVPSVQKVESPNRPPLAQVQQFNRPPFQQPTYSSLPQPQGSQYETAQRYQKQQVQKNPNPRPEQNYNQQQQQQLPYNPKQQQPHINSYSQNQPPSLTQLHSLFDARPSKETELLRAIPKFEQHITETVNGNRYNNYQTYSGANQVIHDIPAPNLGPTTPTSGHSTSSGLYHGGPSTHRQQFNNFVTSPNPIQYQSSTAAPQYVKSEDGQQIQIVTPMPSSAFYNQQNHHQSQFISSGTGSQPQIIPNSQPNHQQTYYNHQQPRQTESSQFSVSTLHSDVFKELEHRKNSLAKYNNINIQPKQNFKNYENTPETKTTNPSTSTPAAPTTTSKNAAKNSLQLPDEVPEDLRQQLLSSGILDNADISVLDYDKVGDVALENLPAEHLQHFYGAGGGAQISESNKVLTVVKPNGDSVDFSEKNINKVKETKSLPRKQNVDLKVVHYNANNERNVTNKHIKTDSTVVPSVDLADKQYNRYLPLKINGAQFPIPDVEELQGKKIASVVVLAPVDNLQGLENDQSNDERIERDTTDSKEVKFVTGDIIKQLIKKPTKENFKKWLEKESRTDVDSQSVVLLVAKSSADNQEIFMYDIATGAVNKLNGELSSAFVSVAEENASAENLDHASTLDPSILENMMEKMKTV